MLAPWARLAQCALPVHRPQSVEQAQEPQQSQVVLPVQLVQVAHQVQLEQRVHLVPWAQSSP